MMSLTFILHAMAAAVAVSAIPVREAHIEARQALEARQGGIDVGRNCGAFAPAPGDCGILSSTTFFNWGAGDNWGTLVNDGCGQVDAQTYEAQGGFNGHRVELTLPSGRRVSAHLATASPDGISEATVEIDGVGVPWVDCDSQTRSRNDGGVWRYWRMCNFPC